MKKFFAIVLCAACLLSALVLPSFAATKNDLVTEASKSHLYKYVKVAVENAIRTMNITDAQADQLLPIVKASVAVTAKHTNTTTTVDAKGQNYSDAEIAEMMGYVDQACAILGLTYTQTLVKSPKHVGDFIFKFYDNKGNIVLAYDGDMVFESSGAYVIGYTEDGKVVYSNQADQYEFLYYDQDGNAIYKYIGGGSGSGSGSGTGTGGGSSVIKDTGAGEYQNTVIAISAASALIVAAGATFVVARKKVFED